MPSTASSSRRSPSNFDAQLEYVLTAMISSAEIGPEGEVLFNRAPADQRFLEPYSGLYYQISGAGRRALPSRSLWDRRLEVGRATATTMPIITTATNSPRRSSG